MVPWYLPVLMVWWDSRLLWVDFHVDRSRQVSDSCLDAKFPVKRYLMEEITDETVTYYMQPSSSLEWKGENKKQEKGMNHHKR